MWRARRTWRARWPGGQDPRRARPASGRSARGRAARAPARRPARPHLRVAFDRLGLCEVAAVVAAGPAATVQLGLDTGATFRDPTRSRSRLTDVRMRARRRRGPAL